MLKIQLLGSCQLNINNKALSLKRKAEWLLLGYLLTNGPQPHSRSALADVVREDPRKEIDEVQKLKNLSSIFHALRRDLGETVPIKASQCFQATARQIGFNFSCDFETDVPSFEVGLEQANESKPIEQKAAALEKALTLYTGDFMPGFYIPWCHDKREELKEKYAKGLFELAQLQQKLQNLPRALECAEQAVQIKPTHELFHHFLILLYQAQGQSEKAVEQYEACEHHLRTLGVTPSPETQSLVSRIKEFGEIQHKATLSGPHILNLLYNRTLQDIEIAHLLGKRKYEVEAIVFLEQTAKELKDEEKLIEVSLKYAAFNNVTGAFEQAKNHALKALSLSKAIGNPTREFDSLHLLGAITFNQRNLDASEDWYQKAMKIGHSKANEIKCINELAGIQYMKGDINRAVRLLEQSTTLASEINDQKLEVIAKANLGSLYDELGLKDKAIRAMRDAMDFFYQQGDIRRGTLTENNLASIYLGIDRSEEALKHLKNIHKLRLAIDDKEAHPTTFYNMGVAYLNLQQWTQAINSFSQAIEASNVVNLAGQMSSSYSFRSKAYRKAGDLPKALADSEEALRLASTTVIEHLHHLYFRHYEVLLDCGHRDQAKIYLEKAHRHLMDLAKDLNDAGEKKSFLESHEVNRHILEAWAQIK